jgi:amidohydrolase
MASSDGFDIVVKGKQSHGALPHLGIDAVVVSAQIIQALQTIPSRRISAIEPIVVTVGKIDGGVRRNVIAQEVHMEGTLRTLNKNVREEAQALIAKLAAEVAAANGATAAVTWSEHVYPVTYNDPTLTEQTLPIMQAVVGKENVVLSDPQMGAEDFSEYELRVPGMFYYLGIRNEARGITAGWHTPDYDIDERALDIGVNVMSNIVLDYLDRHAKAGAASSASK